VWTDEVAYYVENYALAPEAELYRHIVAQGYRCPTLDAAAVRNAHLAFQWSWRQPAVVPGRSREARDVDEARDIRNCGAGWSRSASGGPSGRRGTAWTTRTPSG
jgi:hypothetical protein